MDTNITTFATATATATTFNFNTNTLRTLPRKRRPRAVGEVSITCPSSCVYLNGDIKEDTPTDSADSAITEHVYQNTCLDELKEKLQSIPKPGEGNKPTRNVVCQRQRIHLTFIRATIAEVDETREGMVMSTFVGWYFYL